MIDYTIAQLNGIQVGQIKATLNRSANKNASKKGKCGMNGERK